LEYCCQAVVRSSKEPAHKIRNGEQINNDLTQERAVTVGLVIAAPPNADPFLAPWFSSLRLPGTDIQ
jgi:hypothetical protein